MLLIAHPQNRNQGTIGGSLAHADPAAELPALALALDATFQATGPSGERARSRPRDFFLTYLTTVARADRDPDRGALSDACRRAPAGRSSRWRGGTATSRSRAWSRSSGSHPTGGCASARLVFFGVGATPIRAARGRGAAGGARGRVRRSSRGSAARAAADLEEPLTDVHASADYRRDLARVLTGRALAEATTRAARRVSDGDATMTTTRRIGMTVNGERHEAEVEPRTTLVDFLRGTLGLTGTHVGCEHGVCGACTVLWNGKAVRSCIMLAVQADGAELMTVEGLADGRRRCTRSSRRSSRSTACNAASARRAS